VRWAPCRLARATGWLQLPEHRDDLVPPEHLGDLQRRLLVLVLRSVDRPEPERDVFASQFAANSSPGLSCPPLLREGASRSQDALCPPRGEAVCYPAMRSSRAKQSGRSRCRPVHPRKPARRSTTAEPRRGRSLLPHRVWRCLRPCLSARAARRPIGQPNICSSRCGVSSTFILRHDALPGAHAWPFRALTDLLPWRLGRVKVDLLFFLFTR